MNYRKLGNTELEVSEIGFGCSSYWGNKNFSEKRASNLIYKAIDNGINFFDTGHNYSNFNAEPRLGRIIKEFFKTNDRSKIILSTKGGTVKGATSLYAQKSNQDFSIDSIEKTILKSIENLNCDYLDIFQLHGIGKSQSSDALFEKLLKLKEQGLFRYLGANSHILEDLKFIGNYPEVFDMVLLDYNVLQLDRNPIIEELTDKGIGVIAGTVLAQGHLTQGKIGSVKTGAYFWYLLRTLFKSNTKTFRDSSKQMKAVLSSVEEMSAAQAAFSYVLENQGISSCILGTTSHENLMEIIDATNKKLTEESKRQILETFKKTGVRISK